MCALYSEGDDFRWYTGKHFKVSYMPMGRSRKMIRTNVEQAKVFTRLTAKEESTALAVLVVSQEIELKEEYL